MKPTAILIIIVPFVTLITTYLIYYLYNPVADDDTYVPFISTTISFAPSTSIGVLGFGVTVGLFVFLYAFKYKYSIMQLEKIKDVKQRFVRLNQANLALGVSSSFGLLGLVAFPITVSTYTHDVFTVIFFGLGIVYTLSQSLFDYLLEINSKNVRVYRITVTSFNILFTLICLILNPVKTVAAQTTSAFTELLAVLTFFMYFTSFYIEFAKSDVILYLVEVPPRTITPEAKGTINN